MKIELSDEDTANITEAVIKALRPLLSPRQTRALEEDFFDVPSLAAFLKVDVGWIYRQVYNKNIPFFKVGKYVRFRKSEIEDWFMKQKKGPQ